MERCFILTNMIIMSMFSCSYKDGCRQGLDYNGDISVSISGKHCIEWQSVQYLSLGTEPLNLDWFSDLSWSELGNKCRYCIITICLY